VYGFRDLFWVLRGRCFIFGALFPSKSGLIHKHIVKHIGVGRVAEIRQRRAKLGIGSRISVVRREVAALISCCNDFHLFLY
jgi:hypothetical protein